MATPNGLNNGIVLSGGGANGAYEVGVLVALHTGKSPATNYTELHPMVITGTSIGAYNTAVLTAHIGSMGDAALDYLQNVWINLIPRDDHTRHNHVYEIRGDVLELLQPGLQPVGALLNLAGDAAFFSRDWFQRGINFFSTGGSLEQRTLELVDMSTIFNREPTNRLIQKTIPFADIRQTSIALRIAATNWKTGELRIFENSDMTEGLGYLAILASSAIPGVFQPVDIDGVPYVDGGVVMNTPLQPAIHAGADVIHAIYLDPNVEAIPLNGVRNTIDTIGRMTTISMAATISRDVETVRRLNESLAVLDKVQQGEEFFDQDLRRFVESAGEIAKRMKTSNPYRPLTIHLYHPHDDLSGMLGMLNFDRDRMISLIQRGYSDAVNHDCIASGCVLP
jgi:predicted acylesterase/phospholipase RssA